MVGYGATEWSQAILDRKDPTKDGAQIEIRPKNDPKPISIPPMFKYPSDQHLGELKQ